MFYRLDIVRYRLFISWTKYSKIRGVCSNLPDGRHILLWDFDNVKELDVVKELDKIQHRYRLSTIYIINTGLEKYWHAYCFTALPYPEMLRILADTKGVDRAYLSIGVLRGYYTLRYQNKKGRKFGKSILLHSRLTADVSPLDLPAVEYFYKEWGGEHK